MAPPPKRSYPVVLSVASFSTTLLSLMASETIPHSVCVTYYSVSSVKNGCCKKKKKSKQT